MRSRIAVGLIFSFLGCGGRLTNELGGTSSSNVDAERAAAESGSGSRKGAGHDQKAPTEETSTAPSTPPGIPSPKIPAPLQEPGLVIDGTPCDVTNETVVPLAPPGNQWFADGTAVCGGIGAVSFHLKALRDMPFPMQCGGWNQLQLLTAANDAGGSYWSENPGGACTIASGPEEGHVAFTAVIVGSAGDAHGIAYRSGAL